MHREINAYVSTHTYHSIRKGHRACPRAASVHALIHNKVPIFNPLPFLKQTTISQQNAKSDKGNSFVYAHGVGSADSIEV